MNFKNFYALKGPGGADPIEFFKLALKTNTISENIWIAPAPLHPLCLPASVSEHIHGIFIVIYWMLLSWSIDLGFDLYKGCSRFMRGL